MRASSILKPISQYCHSERSEESSRWRVEAVCLLSLRERIEVRVQARNAPHPRFFALLRKDSE